MIIKRELTIGRLHELLSIVCVFLMAVTMIKCSDTFTEPVIQQEPSPPQSLTKVSGGLPPDGTLPHGASYAIRMPVAWNGDLVIYAHGYVAFTEPPGTMPDDEMEGISVSKTVTDLGYAYATTSYRANGLVVPAAVEDLLELVTEFKLLKGTPRHVLLVGASEGALIATLAVERNPQVFHGAMPASGPVGDFRKQIDYLGDFRVVFDYLFPTVLTYNNDPRTPLPFVVPVTLAPSWPVYEQKIRGAIATANAHTVEQLLRVTSAPIDPANPATAAQTTVDILWYNFFATKDAEEKLGGQPFDNTWRWYTGSDNDWKLNTAVRRIKTTGNALSNINRSYQTSGDIHRPVVTMHTTLDHVVPYWHEPIYTFKTLIKGSLPDRVNIPIMRYGHGTFKIGEVLAGFAVLVLKVTLSDLIVAKNVLPDAAQREEFLRLAQQNGARPEIVETAVSLK